MKFLCLQISEKNVVGPATLGISLLVGSVTIIRPSDPFFCTQSVAICFWVQVYKENVASPRCRAGKKRMKFYPTNPWKARASQPHSENVLH